MRPFRFGLIWSGEKSPVALARRAEDAGYATLLFPDHTGMMAPLPAMAAAAAVTDRIRLGTQMVNIAFRPLGALAQEAAAVDGISDGRLELGIGTGVQEQEALSLGLPFPPPGVRVAEVARALEVLPRLFAGQAVTEEPGPGRLSGFRLHPLPPQRHAVPLAVGGAGDRILSVAARGAGIVQFTGFTAGRDFSGFSADGLADRVGHVRRAAGDRFAGLELSVLVQWAGPDLDPGATVGRSAAVSSGALSTEQALGSPFILLGSVDEICDRLVGLRERYGVSYITVFDGRSDGFDRVVARLAGT